jgi:hypothetical protein
MSQATAELIEVAEPPEPRVAPSDVRTRHAQADRTVFWLSTAIVLGLLLRVHCLLFPYLWLDEYVTLWSIGGETYGEMLRRSMQWTASSPLFVLVYRASCDLVGNIDLGLKLPGVIGGTIAIWVTWWTARRFYGDGEVALVAAWLVALAPQFIHFSQEGRPYMIASVLLLAASGFLAGWLQSGRRSQLAAIVALSIAAVGFQLLSVLAIAAHNVIVLCSGVYRRWPKHRWVHWVVAQLILAGGLSIVGTQFHTLGRRQGSMILDTALPMPTRLALDAGLWGQLQVEAAFVLIGLAFWWCAWRFPKTDLARAWSARFGAVCMAGATFWVPTVLLTACVAMRFVDGWPRYYFLFYPGIMLALAWLVAGAFPKNLSRILVVAVLGSAVMQFNYFQRVPSCRLNLAWCDFTEAERDIQSRFGPGDLILSRSGLIESNQESFLTDPIGASYLKCFCEARTGRLAAEHLPLPFSPESDATRNYLDRVFAEKALTRDDFWLANIGESDFDYRDWIEDHFGDVLERRETVAFRMITLTHYVNVSR